MALGQVPALAAAIAVDGSTCTLADAITAANTDTPAGGCTAGSGADTLELVAGSTHTLTTVVDGSNGDDGAASRDQHHHDYGQQQHHRAGGRGACVSLADGGWTAQGT